ncbi:hypothetical protein [Sphingomonas sp. UNC305MFCol5.2]|uniref:hypothetical protein n=1 Tax=Sphingomonas sp. UNC305MFCol5.2 TaxID=1449076 RepID=UPI0004A76B44|nr:hypothetical protein [Sphingomonas sp. UNC305MFCol5.2]
MAIDHVLRTWPYDPAGIIAWSAAATQLPLLAGLGWCEALRDAVPPSRPPAVEAGATHELIVPPPIEDEGEHALFA